MEKEFNPFARKFRSGLKKVALVYPNEYRGGIANIGLQYIYASVNEIAICERFYSDVFGGMRSIESGTPLNEFDIALFSLQYESDYFSAVRILKKSGFKGLKIAGGPCVMENPKPLLRYFDAFFIGEVDDKIEEIISAKSVEELSTIPGIFTGKEEKVKRVYSKLDKHLSEEIIGRGAYGRCFLVEIGRGCVRRCRFCIVRQIYRPPRWRKKKDLPEPEIVDKIALIAPSPSDHPEFTDILQMYLEKDYEVSPSSVRADTLNEEIVEMLKRANVKTLTIAPETASPDLIEILGKGIDHEDVLKAAELAKNKFEKIKLYYMIGLPGEGIEDLIRIVNQVENVKRYVRRVEVSVNPLVPKPHTPFQWMSFGGEADVERGIESLKSKIRFLSREFRKRKISVKIDSLKEFIVQTILSKGGEEVSGILEGESYRKYLRYADKFDLESELPWDFIDHGYRKDKLLQEYTKVREIVEKVF
jgi:radical SAM superfamily enzyme YgiQ (UPF0313 family)